VELHCHLEGSIRARTLISLADQYGVPLPTRSGLGLYHFADLDAFVRVYRLACDVMRTASDFALVTYESLEDAVMSSNVRYREMFVSPSMHRHTRYEVVLAGVIAGIRAAEHDFGVTARLIPSIDRQGSAAAAVELVETVVRHRDPYVVGIGMDGAETGVPPERFVEAYALAGRHGLRRSAHVAHEGPAEYVATCVRELGCDRIDHGYHVVDDPTLTARLRDDGVTFVCSTATPPLWGWPNVLAVSPVRSMVDAGLRVTINTDDPSMLRTDLATEFVKVCNA
jgi:adenosine deaminase